MSNSITAQSAKGTTTTYVSFLASLLRKHGKAKSLYHVQLVHTHLIACGYESSTYLRNCLIQSYGDCGNAEDAEACFDTISSNTYSWTFLIKALAVNGFLDEALIVFRRNPFKDVVTWNSTITLLVQHGRCRNALDLFYSMPNERVEVSAVTFLCAIDACIKLESVLDGQRVHSTIRDSRFGKNLAVGSALVNMYGKWGIVDEARSVFDSLPNQDVVLLTAMIAAYAENEELEEALYLFHQMLLTGMKPDVVLYVSLLNRCTKLRAFEEGRYVHFVVEHNNIAQNVMVATALITMYGKCAHVHEVQGVFDRLTQKDVVSFNAIMAAYEQNECGEKALVLFYKLYSGDIYPSITTFVCVLDACASLAALEEGRLIHLSIVCEWFEKDFLIQFALLHMYGKSGSIENAKDVFSRIYNPNLITWNAMIAALSHNGETDEAILLFRQMQVEGVEPDDGTFVSLLTACSHCGYVEYSKYIFNVISRAYGLLHTFSHFLSLHDTLTRAGRLDEAEALIHYMPLEIMGVAYRCLLGACVIHGDEGRGVRVASNCLAFEPWNALPYVAMSNLFISGGMPKPH